jgi:hypothetical protein
VLRGSVREVPACDRRLDVSPQASRFGIAAQAAAR